MSSWSFAPIVTHLSDFTSGVAQQVENGDPIRVWGVILHNTGTDTATSISMQKADGTVIFTQIMNGIRNIVLDVKFIADAGLQFVVTGASPSNKRVTVFHSHPGT